MEGLAEWMLTSVKEGSPSSNFLAGTGAPTAEIGFSGDEGGALGRRSARKHHCSRGVSLSCRPGAAESGMGGAIPCRRETSGLPGRRFRRDASRPAADAARREEASHRPTFPLLEPFGMAGGAKPPGLAGKHQKMFGPAARTADADKPAARITAVQIALDDVLNDGSEITIFPLESALVFRDEPFDML